MGVQVDTLKVLVVDDEDDVRSFLGLMLQKRNFIVTQAANGQEALVKAFEAKPDLIILDIHMPGMDGFQVYHRLRAVQETKDIPVLFCTALRIPDIIDSIKSPCDDYMQKPFDVVTLHEKLENILRLHREGGNN